MKNGNGLTTLIRLLAGVFLLVGCFFFVKAAMIWMNPDSAWTVPEANASTAQSPGATPKSSDTPRLDHNFDPFHRNGTVAVIETPLETTPGDDAEETNLNIKLKGTFAPDIAIIEGSDRRQENYKLGDDVTGGVTLDSVHAGYVILLRDGKREKLSLERDESGLAAPTSAPTQFRGAVRGGASVNPADLLRQVSITPHKNNNRFIGYKISSQPGFDIKPLGFRDGDVITRLGSQDLTQPGIDFNSTVISAVAEGNPTAQIMRRGRRMTIRIRMP